MVGAELAADADWMHGIELIVKRTMIGARIEKVSRTIYRPISIHNHRKDSASKFIGNSLVYSEDSIRCGTRRKLRRLR